MHQCPSCLLSLFRVYEERHSSPVPLYSIAGHPLRSHEICVCGRDPVIRVFDRRAVSWTNVGQRYTPSHRDRSEDYSEPLQQFCAFEQHGSQQGGEKPLWRTVESEADVLTEEAMETAEEELEASRAKEEEEKEEAEAVEEAAGAEEAVDDAEGEGSNVRRRRGESASSGGGGGATRPDEGSVASDAVAAFLVNLHVTSAVYSNNGDGESDWQWLDRSHIVERTAERD